MDYRLPSPIRRQQLEGPSLQWGNRTKSAFVEREQATGLPAVCQDHERGVRETIGKT